MNTRLAPFTHYEVIHRPHSAPTLHPTPIPFDPPKSTLIAGLLQLFFGMGRFYLGSLSIGAAQQATAGIGLLFCLAGKFVTINPTPAATGAGMVLLALGVLILGVAFVWMWVDAALMFAGVIRDKHGRKLR